MKHLNISEDQFNKIELEAIEHNYRGYKPVLVDKILDLLITNYLQGAEVVGYISSKQSSDLKSKALKQLTEPQMTNLNKFKTKLKRTTGMSVLDYAEGYSDDSLMLFNPVTQYGAILQDSGYKVRSTSSVSIEDKTQFNFNYNVETGLLDSSSWGEIRDTGTQLAFVRVQNLISSGLILMNSKYIVDFHPKTERIRGGEIILPPFIEELVKMPLQQFYNSDTTVKIFIDNLFCMHTTDEEQLQMLYKDIFTRQDTPLLEILGHESITTFNENIFNKPGYNSFKAFRNMSMGDSVDDYMIRSVFGVLFSSLYSTTDTRYKTLKLLSETLTCELVEPTLKTQINNIYRDNLGVDTYASRLSAKPMTNTDEIMTPIRKFRESAGNRVRGEQLADLIGLHEYVQQDTRCKVTIVEPKFMQLKTLQNLSLSERYGNLFNVGGKRLDSGKVLLRTVMSTDVLSELFRTFATRRANFDLFLQDIREVMMKFDHLKPFVLSLDTFEKIDFLDFLEPWENTAFFDKRMKSDYDEIMKLYSLYKENLDKVEVLVFRLKDEETQSMELMVDKIYEVLLQGYLNLLEFCKLILPHVLNLSVILSDRAYEYSNILKIDLPTLEEISETIDEKSKEDETSLTKLENDLDDLLNM